MSMKDNIKAWRTGAGLSQEEAARVLLISTSAFQKYESGARNPSGATLARMLKLIAQAEERGE